MNLNLKVFLKGRFKKENIKRVLQYALFMLLMLIFQTMVVTHFRPLGVCAFVLPTAAIAVGMFEGASFGTVFGLALGIFTDMFYVESTVMYTILFPALAFAAGFTAQYFINRRFVSFIAAAFAGMLITGFVQMLGVSLKDSFSFSMIFTVILQTLWTMPLSLLAYFPAARWIE